jgi:alpha-acetolactate decarboxylase
VISAKKDRSLPQPKVLPVFQNENGEFYLVGQVGPDKCMFFALYHNSGYHLNYKNDRSFHPRDVCRAAEENGLTAVDVPVEIRIEL